MSIGLFWFIYSYFGILYLSGWRKMCGFRSKEKEKMLEYYFFDSFDVGVGGSVER